MALRRRRQAASPATTAACARPVRSAKAESRPIPKGRSTAGRPVGASASAVAVPLTAPGAPSVRLSRRTVLVPLQWRAVARAEGLARALLGAARARARLIVVPYTAKPAAPA